MKVGVHARLEHGNAAQPRKVRGSGVVAERAGDEYVEVGLAGLILDKTRVYAALAAVLIAGALAGTAGALIGYFIIPPPLMAGSLRDRRYGAQPRYDRPPEACRRASVGLRAREPGT